MAVGLKTMHCIGCLIHDAFGSGTVVCRHDDVLCEGYNLVDISMLQCILALRMTGVVSGSGCSV